MTTAHDAFLAVHNEYLQQAEIAYATGETSGCEAYMHAEFNGYFGTRQEVQASPYGREDARSGIAQTARAYPGCRSGCEHRLVRMPSEREAIVFFGKPMDFGNGKSGYAFVMEVWRQQDDGAWLLVRETVESA